MESATGGNNKKTRMRWSADQNKNAMRAYYRATEGETNRTGYRVRLLREFNILEPNITLTEQNLVDRVRYILRRNIFSASELEQLGCAAVSAEAPEPMGVDDPPDVSVLFEENTGVETNAIGAGETEEIATQDMDKIRRELEETISHYRGIPVEQRSQLPRVPYRASTRLTVETVNKLLPPYLETSTDIGDTGSILYAAAVVVCRAVGINFSNTGRGSPQRHTTPAWRRRIETRIANARVLIGKLTAFRAGNTRPRVMRFVRSAISEISHNLPQAELLRIVTVRIDTLKQQVAAWGKRIRRYSETTRRHRENRLFESDQRKFYKYLQSGARKAHMGPQPEKADLIAFWRGIWSHAAEHVEGAWMMELEEACVALPPMDPVVVTRDDISAAVRKCPNWKTPGVDGLQTYWLKGFNACHATLARQFGEAIEHRLLPNFLTTGVTYLAPKSNRSADPSQYRPITCLPTIYKALTSVLAAKIAKHIDGNRILADTQNGCRAGGRGTKELLLIDTVIGQQVKRNRRNLSAAWIDYKKAFDSVPHTWLTRVLELYKIDPSIRGLLGTCMGQWSTMLCLQGKRLSDAEDRIKIRRGIFQGDCLSPLWFCLALNPLSYLLERLGSGFQLRRGGLRLNHLLYMDDLKLFAPNRSRLTELLKITCDFSSSIGMELGVDKCAVIHVERGKVTTSDDITPSGAAHLRVLTEAETYRYLGMSQNICVEGVSVKQDVAEVFCERMTKVFNSYLSGVNKIRAFNTWVMPVLLYTFGVLKWTQTELNALDRKVRTTMTLHRLHHPKSSVMRLYIPRRCGGRGMLSAQSLHNREICKLRDYFLAKVSHAIHAEVIECDKGLTPLSLAKQDWQKPAVLSISDREAIWKEKELHGRFHRILHEPHVDFLSSVHWLRFGDLFGETEGFVCAIQDQVVKTNNYRRYIIKDGTQDLCRMCHRPGETLRHVTSGCSMLANTEYLHRHNLAARIIHQELALKYGLLVGKVPYYKYAPEPVLENNRAKLYWDRPIITDRTILANRPDIVVMDLATSRIFLVDITIPHDDNLVKADSDKRLKYLDLAHEVVEMWGGVSAEIIPIVVSTNGLIPSSLKQYLRRLDLPVKPMTVGIQRAVLLDNARIVRRFLTQSP
ncbi:uncharacterized protein LOC123705416 [Colias croceus]|uniref:uncharacterized protein LOC123705416 n=1 Tax=Colias crocea TaxID=72248 RepID=UPI001E27DFA7|nr:uncharacterized protein LOC123705416 [Colias croceus]